MGALGSGGVWELDRVSFSASTKFCCFDNKVIEYISPCITLAFELVVGACKLEDDKSFSLRSSIQFQPSTQVLHFSKPIRVVVS